MSAGPMNQILRHLRSILRDETDALPDAQLLARFLSRRDESAFETLLHRHGPMVLGVCRRILGNTPDVEDAFQATFLVLVRKANTIARRETVGGFRYGVAYRTALKARAADDRRRAKERRAAQMSRRTTTDEDDAGQWQDWLDQELSRLPDMYRVPIVLCDLEGKTRREAARQLGWKEGTLSGRLARARALLGQRLARRGVTLSGGVTALGLTPEAMSAEVPRELAASTVRVATGFAAGRLAAAGVVSAKVMALTQGVLKAMLLTKLRMALAVALALSILGLGAGAYRSFSAAANPEDDPPGELKAKVKVIAPGQSKIAYGRTAPGEGWQPYAVDETKGIYIDVDTSAAKFKSPPVYITSLGGEACHWEVTGVSAIYAREDADKKPLPLESGFRIYLRFPTANPDYNLAEFQEAQKRWYINWVAYGE
jgi:RNA polymerase sigma factor (sigma-70 family)